MTKIAPAEYRPDTAIAPGETIREMIDEFHMTRLELASGLNLSEDEVSQLLNGERQITFEIATELELVLGLHPDFWMNLEKNYQSAKTRIEGPSCPCG